jgi:very-short-patch-repair endonuclease
VSRRNTNIARKLRRNVTEPERLLWRHLRGARIHSVKFRRQFAVCAYIADFASWERKLIIELDGG